MSLRAPAAATPIEILVAEDSATQAERLCHLLEEQGYRVTLVGDGRPALVISDINMPEMNGYELCQKIKSDARWQGIPVILLTSLSDAADVLDGLACGADSFITKPYSNDYLLARVERTLVDASAFGQPMAGSLLEIPIPGQNRMVTADPRRMVSLLISTYEAAVYRNTELVETQAALRELNEHLEDLVAERTAVLTAEISVRQLAEGKIRYLAGVLENVSDGIVSTDLNGDIQSWNLGAEAMFGQTAAEAIGRPYAQAVPYEYLDEAQAEVNATLARTTRWKGEVRVRRTDGSVIHVLVGASALKNSAGLITGFTAVLHDITERKQRERELEAIAAISLALRGANTQAQMLPLVLGQLMALLGASDAALGLRDPLTNELILALVQGERIGRAGQRLPAGMGIGGQVLITGQPHMSVNVIADPYYYALTALSDARAVACVPLITTTQVLGVLWAERLAPFTEADMRVFSAIAGIAANAMQRAGLYEQTEQRLRRLAALREIDSTIMNSLDLRTTLFILLEQVTTQLGVDASDILLLSRGMNVLEYEAGRGFRSRAVERSRLRLGEGYAGLAALERRLVAVPDLLQPGLNPAGPFRRSALLADEAFLALFCVPLVAKGQVVGVLEVFHRAPLNPDADWLAFLETLAGQAAIAVADASLFHDLQQSNSELLLAYDTTLEGWSAALDLRDHETEGHSQRVTETTLRLAQSLGVSERDLEQIRRGSLLHDIGKMGIPDVILLKPGQLNDDEMAIMRRHPLLAYDLLRPIAYLRPALDIPYCHHEKWDGTGYPRQLKGDAIPLAARIFAVVDVWDALRSDRPYRLGWPDDQVWAYIRDQAGTHFDPRVVSAFFTILEQPA